MLNELRSSSPVAIELLEEWIAFSWAISFLNPYTNLFDISPTLFKALEAISKSQMFWGFVFLIIGCVGFTSTILKRKKWRRRSAILFAFVWSFLAIMFARAEIGSTGVLIYLGHAIASAGAAALLTESRGTNE